MKTLVKSLLAVAVLVTVLMAAGTRTAEARRVYVYDGGWYAPVAPAYEVYAPRRAVYRPYVAPYYAPVLPYPAPVWYPY